MACSFCIGRSGKSWPNDTLQLNTYVRQLPFRRTCSKKSPMLNNFVCFVIFPFTQFCVDRSTFEIGHKHNRLMYNIKVKLRLNLPLLPTENKNKNIFFKIITYFMSLVFTILIFYFEWRQWLMNKKKNVVEMKVYCVMCIYRLIGGPIGTVGHIKLTTSLSVISQQPHQHQPFIGVRQSPVTRIGFIRPASIAGTYENFHCSK